MSPEDLLRELQAVSAAGCEVNDDLLSGFHVLTRDGVGFRVCLEVVLGGFLVIGCLPFASLWEEGEVDDEAAGLFLICSPKGVIAAEIQPGAVTDLGFALGSGVADDYGIIINAYEEGGVGGVSGIGILSHFTVVVLLF